LLKRYWQLSLSTTRVECGSTALLFTTNQPINNSTTCVCRQSRLFVAGCVRTVVLPRWEWTKQRDHSPPSKNPNHTLETQRNTQRQFKEVFIHYSRAERERAIIIGRFHRQLISFPTQENRLHLRLPPLAVAAPYLSSPH